MVAQAWAWSCRDRRRLATTGLFSAPLARRDSDLEAIKVVHVALCEGALDVMKITPWKRFFFFPGTGKRALPYEATQSVSFIDRPVLVIATC